MNAWSTSWRTRAWLRTALAAAAVLGLLTAVCSVASRLPADSGRPAASRGAVARAAGAAAATVPEQPGEPASSSSRPPATSGGGLASGQAPTAQVPADESQADSVARAFLVAYASYRYDDGPGALRARLRPYDTDAFDVALGSGGGAGTQDEQRSARHEVATAGVLQLSTTGLAPDGRLILVLQVSQQVRSDRGSTASTRYVELYLARTDAGWRVDEVAL